MRYRLPFAILGVSLPFFQSSKTDLQDAASGENGPPAKSLCPGSG